MIEALRSTFPGVSIMWKPVHVRALSTTEFGRPPFQGSADIHHINQSLRALMNRLHVPVMECEPILKAAPMSSVTRSADLALAASTPHFASCSGRQSSEYASIPRLDSPA